jgi:hypothetical protein
MFAANTYRIRRANHEDADTLRRLAEQGAEPPLAGRVLIGEIAGVGAAALSLSDGRVIADSGPRVEHLLANLRARAVSVWAHEATPALHDRLLAGLPAWYRTIGEPTPAAHDDSAERESLLAHA